MPQLITKQIITENAVIGNGSFYELSGLSASILTGSGWILTTIGVPINQEQADFATVEIALAVDGAIAPTDSSAYTKTTIGQWHCFKLNISHAARLGAGQHILKVYAKSSHTGPFIKGYSAHMIINELGY